MNPVEKVLAALPGRYKSAGRREWRTACPAHGSENPTTLSIKEGDNGTVLLKCFANGCEPAAICQSIGLKISDLFPEDARAHSAGNSPDPFRPIVRGPTFRPQQVASTEAARSANGASALPAANDSPPRKLFTLTRYRDITVKPIAWVIRNYLAENTLAGVVGASGCGKTFVVVGMSCCIATGHPWCGHEVTKGAVFYLAGEGQQGLAKRIAAWERHYSVDVGDAALFISSGLPFLCDPQMTVETIALIEEEADRLFFASGLEPTLIVIDTVARAMNGLDDNSAKDMGLFIRAKDMLRERWGCTVLSIHHTGHDKEKQDRARGSSNYYANLDSEFVVKKTDGGAALYGTKEKDWPKPAPISFSAVSIPVPVPTDEDPTAQESILVLHDAAGSLLEASKREKAIALHRAGQSLRDIAVQLRVSKSTVGNWCKAA